MKYYRQVVILCLFSSVCFVSLTKTKKSLHCKDWLIRSISTFKTELQSTQSITQIRQRYKSIEIAFFLSKKTDLQSKIAQNLLFLEKKHDKLPVKEIQNSLTLLESELKSTNYIEWTNAFVASLRNSYLITLTGWKNDLTYEQKREEALIEIQTLIKLNELGELENKQIISQLLFQYYNYLLNKNKQEIDYKIIYQNYIVPLENAYWKNIDNGENKHFFDINVFKVTGFSDINKQKVELGKTLFYETAFSLNFKRSCASCHRPQKAFCDNRTTSLGFELGTSLTKNAPTLINAIHNNTFFHDGRANNISEVIQAVISNPAEFNNDFLTIIQRLNSSEEYKQKFEGVFAQKDINEPQINDALIAFIGSLSSQNSVFDKWINEKESNEKLSMGFNVFMNNCASCHSAGTFSGFFPLPFSQNEKYAGIKTPTLRNIALTQPYMHDGSEMNLPDIIKKHHGQHLTASENQELMKFLDALTDTNVDKTEPTSLPKMPMNLNRKVGGYY